MNEKSFVYADEKFADLQLLRYQLVNFESLTIQQKKYIYYLSEATSVVISQPTKMVYITLTLGNVLKRC